MIHLFDADIKRENRQQLSFVAFGFSSSMDARRLHSRIIKLLTVQEILDKKHVQKM